MRKQWRSKKRFHVVTPGGRMVVHARSRELGSKQCGRCGAETGGKANGRPERRFPALCPSCSRENLKLAVRGGKIEGIVRGV